MTEQPGMFTRYATLLRQLSGPEYDLQLQIRCIASDDKHPWPINKPLKRIALQQGWDGRIAALIKLPELRMSASQLGLLSRFLPAGGAFLNVLGEAVVESHRPNIEQIVATFAWAAWQQGCRQQGNCEFAVGESPGVGPCVCLMLPARFIAGILTARGFPVGDGLQPAVSKLPRHVQFSRYGSLLQQLSRVRSIQLTASESHPWEGKFHLIVRQPELKLSVDFILSLKPLMCECPEFVNWLAESVLAAHMDDVERFVAGIKATDWEWATGACRHRWWGLTLLPPTKEEPDRLQFCAHVSRVSQLLNERLQQAAAEGAR